MAITKWLNDIPFGLHLTQVIQEGQGVPMRIRDFFPRGRFLLAMMAVLVVASACRGKTKEAAVYEGPVTDSKLKEACLRQADQLIGILREVNFAVPDLRGKQPQKVELNHVADTYPFQTFTIQWPELELTLRTDGGLVELRRKNPPRPPDPPRPMTTTQTPVDDSTMTMAQVGVGVLGLRRIRRTASDAQPHVAPKQSITTETAHRQCLSLLKRLMPLTWQQYDKMRWTRPEEEQFGGEEDAMTGYFHFWGTVNGLPCDEKSVHFTVNYTSNTLEFIDVRDIPGTYPSVQDQKISAEEGARLAMEYLGEEYGKKTQMEAFLHTLKLSFVDRPDGGPSPIKMKWDLHHPRLVHWYKICSWSLPPDNSIPGYHDAVTVDAISGIVLEHDHYTLVGGTPDVNYRNFVFKRFPDKK